MWYQPEGNEFAGKTVVIAGQGPSLVPAQLTYLQEHLTTIALKDTYIHAPNASIVYACDRIWWADRWKTDQALRDHRGIRLCLDWQRMDTGIPDLWWLKSAGAKGLAATPGYVKHSNNTGQQAVDLAVGMGAKRILLLGYTMKQVNGRSHFHDRHQNIDNAILDTYRGNMTIAAKQLAVLGVSVYTVGETALKCFPNIDFNQACAFIKK